jgi:HEAT repeat protein
MTRLLRWTIFALVVCSCRAPAPAEPPQATTETPKTAADLLQAFSSATSFWQQEEVARKIVALGDKTIIPKMQNYLGTQDRRKRCNAALVLAGLGDKRGVAMVIKELEDTKPRPTTLTRSDGKPYPEGQITEDRYYAALLLGQIGDKEAVPVLIEATKDKTVNYRAAISLGDIGDTSAIPALRQMVKDFPDQRLWAGYGLAALGESEGFDILTEVALSDSKWTQRRHAVEAMGKTGDPRTIPTVVKALKDTHVNVRVSAVRALGKIGHPAALPALNEALKDTEVTEINAPTTVEKEARKAIGAIEARKKEDRPYKGPLARPQPIAWDPATAPTPGASRSDGPVGSTDHP